MKQDNNTDQAPDRQPDQAALSSGPPLPSGAALIARKSQLEREADALRERGEDLRDEADDLISEATRKEAAIAAIDKQLRSRGLLYHPEDAERWGVEMAKAIYDTGVTTRLRMLGGDWLSNGHVAWRVDSAPPNLREPRDAAGTERFGAELMGERFGIDLAVPIGIGERSNGRTFTDFNSAVGRVRFDDLYWAAVQASGNEVAVVRVAPSRSGDEQPPCLVAFRDGIATAAAMPITIDSPSRPVESEATP